MVSLGVGDTSLFVITWKEEDAFAGIANAGVAFKAAPVAIMPLDIQFVRVTPSGGVLAGAQQFTISIYQGTTITPPNLRYQNVVTVASLLVPFQDNLLKPVQIGDILFSINADGTFNGPTTVPTVSAWTVFITNNLGNTFDFDVEIGYNMVSIYQFLIRDFAILVAQG